MNRRAPMPPATEIPFTRSSDFCKGVIWVSYLFQYSIHKRKVNKSFALPTKKVMYIGRNLSNLLNNRVTTGSVSSCTQYGAVQPVAVMDDSSSAEKWMRPRNTAHSTTGHPIFPFDGGRGLASFVTVPTEADLSAAPVISPQMRVPPGVPGASMEIIYRSGRSGIFWQKWRSFAHIYGRCRQQVPYCTLSYGQLVERFGVSQSDAPKD